MKNSIIAASAVLIGSVAATQHRAHPAFHNRHYAAEEICTVYTTVYVTASELPPVVASASVPAVPTPASSSCTESSTSIYIPEVSSVVVSSSAAVYTPVVPTTGAAYTPVVPQVPASSAPVVPEVPASSAHASSAPAYTAPAYTPAVPAVPASSAPASSAPASSAPAYTPIVPSVTKEAYTAPAYTPAPVSSKVKTSAAVVSSAKPSASAPSSGGSYSNTGRVVTKGDKWAMTYTPYASNGDCKTASDVQTDIAKIAEMGFTTIRSYSTDCGVFENVVPACAEHGLKVIFGIFLTGGGSAGKGPFSPYADEQLQTIIKNAPKDIIAMVIVGNEFLFNNYGTATELASYIDHVREQLVGAGFPSEIAVTTTEPVAQMVQYGAELCSHLDVFAVQIHPYFSTQVYAANAGDFALAQLALASAVCPEAAAKGQYITEIGWPSAGDTNGNAVPGKAEQKTAMKSILAKVGKESCIFSFQNDNWKEPGALNVEQSFGCADALQ